MNENPPSKTSSPFYDKDFAAGKISPAKYNRLLKQLNTLREEIKTLRARLAELEGTQ